MRTYKLTALVLVAALLLSLAGCGLGGSGTADAADKEALLAILDDLSDNLHPETAGSSLTSIRLAASLVTWAATTKMDKREAAAIVSEWLKEQSPEIRAAFQEKLSSVSASFETIVKDGAADLLEAAGINEDLSNLGTRLKELVGAVLASGGLD